MAEHFLSPFQTERDSETGCLKNSSFFDCKQVFYLKQQNQILSDQKNNTQPVIVQPTPIQYQPPEKSSTNNPYFIFLEGFMACAFLISIVYLIIKKFGKKL